MILTSEEKTKIVQKLADIDVEIRQVARRIQKIMKELENRTGTYNAYNLIMNDVLYKELKTLVRYKEAITVEYKQLSLRLQGCEVRTIKTIGKEDDQI